MKLIQKICVAAGFIMLLFMSCSKDTGNYTYKDLSDYFVDTAKLPKTIVIKQNETITIDPTLVSNPNATGLTYEWRLMQASYAVDPGTGTYFNKQVGSEKKMTYKVIETPGDYILVLYARNSTGLTQISKIPFNVSSYASIGWMVIHGDQTSSDVSIIVNNKLNAILPAGTDYVQANVFNETNGKKIEGEASNVVHFGQLWVDVFTKGSKGGYRLSGNDLRIMNTYSDMFMEPMTASEVDFQSYGNWSYNELLVNKGGLYFTSQPVPTSYNKFGVKCFGEDYVAAPYIGTMLWGGFYGAIYDMKNKRFLYIDYTRTLKTFKAPGATAAFNMSNVGKEMVYAEHGISNRWMCVMQDPGNPATREIYACDLSKSDDGNRGVAKHAISAAVELNAAKFFAFGNKANVMYYATDTKIYQNDYSGSLASTLRLDLATNYPGFKVTSMKLLKVNGHVSDGKILFVAIYNDASKEGKVLQIDVSEITGVFSTLKEYTGFGKIAGMNYKTK